MRITYAAKGMIEWQMALDVKGAIVRICFTGGSMGTNGVIPAKYVTENEVMQRLIESTKEFKSGRIFVYSKVKVRKDEKGSA